MPSYRLLIVALLAITICDETWSSPEQAFAQALSTTAAPQQMIPNGATTYPSTTPPTTTNYPATSSYPSTNGSASNNVGAATPTYPSTASADVSTTANPYVSGTASPYASSSTANPYALNPYASSAGSTGSIAPFASTTPSLMASTAPISSNTPGKATNSNDFGLSAYSNSPCVQPPSNSLSPTPYFEHAADMNGPWTWQLLPSGFMFAPELASPQEYRLGSEWVHERNLGWLWDVSLGGRAGLVRYGTQNSLLPQGWQWDVYGGITGRLDSAHDVVSTDYHIYTPITTRQGPWEFKIGYSHLSSHLADEYMLKTPGFRRLNYVRDSILSGVAFYVSPSLRLYADAGWGFYVDDGAEPWEFLFGVDFSSPEPTGATGAPFCAVNAHLRQEHNFSGSFTAQAGWQWRGQTGHLLRIGMQYLNGMSEQYQFYDHFEEQIGAGLWYDY